MVRQNQSMKNYIDPDEITDAGDIEFNEYYCKWDGFSEGFLNILPYLKDGRIIFNYDDGESGYFVEDGKLFYMHIERVYTKGRELSSVKDIYL